MLCVALITKVKDYILPKTVNMTSKIGGVDIKINATPADVKTLTPLYKKEDRRNLSDDKRNEHFDRATKQAHTKYETISLNLNDENKLDNTYNLSIGIGKTRDDFIMYDLHNIFTILLYPDPKDETKIIAEKDLFRDRSKTSCVAPR
jgi:hypothetical protein